MAKFWDFKNVAATETEPETIELWIKGEIVPDDDVWLYEWAGMEAASPNAFKEELKQYNGKPISLWIDSPGGDVFAATGMFVALMERKGQNNINVLRAMSAATMPMMAGESGITPGGMIMIHDPLVGLSGYFNAEDLVKFGGILGEVKETIISAYQTKTNLSRNKIWQMMTDETYMSPRTALRDGFVDKILYTEKQNEEPIENFSRLSVVNSASITANQLMAFKNKLPIPKILEPKELIFEPNNTAKAKATLALECEL